MNQFPLPENNIERKRTGRKKKYHTEGVLSFIKTLWKKTNLICSDRLKSAIPIWLPIYKKSISALSKKDEELLRSISAATIYRVLSKFRGKYTERGLCTTRPGFLEVDLVAHCGTSVSGEYVNEVKKLELFRIMNRLDSFKLQNNIEREIRLILKLSIK